MMSLIRTLLCKLRLMTPDDTTQESPELKECYRFLHLTSRSFAALILKIPSELRASVCLFYLTLRGLDTIEDDMTIDIKEKERLLRNFHKYIDKESWNYSGNGPQERDRELLVKFDVVKKELKKIKEEYRIIIKDITNLIGNGFADFATESQKVQTIQDYKLYCHYAAGLVAEGITRLCVKAKMVDPALLKRPELIESVGQLMQQTNIIRDIREDYEEKRCFWPEEVWNKYVDTFPEIFLSENKEKALQCQSEMIFLALQNVKSGLLFMGSLREQSILCFAALPQIGAIATLELLFQNYAMFERVTELSRVDVCDLMVRSRNFQGVCEVFRECVRKIRGKNQTQDPHFLDINNVCDEIEKYIESEFPTQTIR